MPIGVRVAGDSGDAPAAERECVPELRACQGGAGGTYLVGGGAAAGGRGGFGTQTH